MQIKWLKTYLARRFTTFENEPTFVKKFFRQVTKSIPVVVYTGQVNVEPFAKIVQNNVNSVDSKFRSVVVQNLDSLKEKDISIK